MARSRRRRSSDYQSAKRVSAWRSYSLPKSQVYLGKIDYLSTYNSFTPTSSTTSSVTRSRPAVRMGRQVAKRSSFGTFKFNPGAQFLFEQAPKKSTLSVREPERRKVCKCTHERSEEQRRNSRKFFSGHGSRGIERPTHVCKC